MSEAEPTSDDLTGKRVAFLVAREGIEQAELTDPWDVVTAAGATPTLVSTEVGDVQAFDHLTAADTFEATLAASGASVDDFDALVLPGGVANPDQLRTDADAVGLVGAFFAAGKPVAAICHAPWTLIEAGVTEGRTLTSWPSLRTDIENSGGTWVDEQVAVCTSGPNTLITSRNPDDLEAFGAEIVRTLGRT
ncbi:MAG: type 1 glutamine amidotransferase domain-containing protein [Ilumatobacter sp.]|uniref:type 1 glutamine amidotransferase domain-containing protein n=1 Tax=Ilumatobacter sp. TaxID=1967498 RepID=UPI003299EA47